ncbi:MAG: TIGR03915 family putative DNA repair protein, partial [Defluviitaleaceae bacterium]|nr:TIGR03915 family putative DNA repair protein [Defluviitaleaceae bacterium]
MTETLAKVKSEFAVLFDGSFDGFLCVVHAFYRDKIVPVCIQTEREYQKAIGVEEYFVASDESKSAEVIGAIRKKISENSAHYLYNAFLADREERFMDMFRYALLGFRKGHLVDNLMQEDCVLRVHKLAKQVGRETHLMCGFSRFAETKQGVYYCEITPKNNIAALLADHFSSRFMNHAWVIHDKTRKIAAIYDGCDYFVESVPGDATFDFADREEQMQGLWATFFSTIAIEERSTHKRQRQMLPLYFRGQMTEFR